MSEERKEEDRVLGLLRFSLGGTPVELPVLKIRQARAWKTKLSAVNINDTTEPLDHPVDVMLDLVVAYDVGGILGGLEAIEDRATDREVYQAFNTMLEATFPFVETAALTRDFSRLVVAAFFAQANSTSGVSPIGTSTRTRSRTGSPTSNSSSSGRKARAA